MQRLDPLCISLAGLNLIEASAGTGKTYTITALYARLVVEAGIPVSRILVVTYTNAATKELRDRIRTRLSDLRLAFLRGRAAEHDELATRLLDLLPDRELAIRRLNNAVRGFDEAAIFTIHGFCQRALADAPFSAAQPFELDAVQDDQERLQQAVYDFWRRRVAHAPPGSLSPLLARYLRDVGDTPEKLAALLRPVVAKRIQLLGAAGKA